MSFILKRLGSLPGKNHLLQRMKLKQEKYFWNKNMIKQKIESQKLTEMKSPLGKLSCKI